MSWGIPVAAALGLLVFNPIPLRACEPDAPADNLTSLATTADQLAILAMMPARPVGPPAKLFCRAWDKQVRLTLDASDQRPYCTPLGAIIDYSCFKGKSAAEQQEFVAKIEKALSRMQSQISWCKHEIGFPVLDRLADKLHLLQLVCSDHLSGGPGAMMEAQTMNPHGWNPSRSLFAARTYTTPDFDNVNIVTMRNDVAKQLDSLNFADLMFHELSHLTPSNNRSWHNDWSKEGGGHDKFNDCKLRPDGVHTNSLFEDRVYFMEAACFPQSEGINLYHSQHNLGHLNTCPSVCVNALTESDNPMDPPGTGPFHAILGPTLNATPMPRQQAREICGRVTAVNATREQVTQRAGAAGTLIMDAQTAADALPRDGGTGEGVSRLLSEISRASTKFFYDSETDPYLARPALLARIAQARLTVGDACRAATTDDWRGFCGAGRARLTEKLDALETSLTAMGERELGILPADFSLK